MKDAYYFTHDSNAKDDPKCMMLIETLQLEGYGIFWMLVETLRDQPNYKYPLILVPALARRYNTTAEKIKAVIQNYGLFQVDDREFFYSESLNTRMIAWDNSKEKFRLAGIASGKARRLKALEHQSNDVQTSIELIDKNRVDKNIIKKTYNPDYIRLVKYLINHIENNDSDYFKNKDKEKLTEKWYDPIRLLVERDGRSVESVKKVIEWCQDDDFWKTNILSTAKLRKQFPTLWLKVKGSVTPEQEEIKMKVNNEYDPTGRLEREKANAS